MRHGSIRPRAWQAERLPDVTCETSEGVDDDIRFNRMAMAKILIVDDNAAMREAVGIILEDEHDLNLCGEASCASDALEQCVRLQPDLALIDISLKGEDGLELVGRLRECSPAVRTIVLSLHDEPFYIDRARAAGAQGYVIKSEDPLLLLDCIRTVLDGRQRFPNPELP